MFIWLLRVIVVACAIFSCGMQAPLVVVCELLVVACMWDLVPWPGMEPGPPALGARSLNHWTTSEVPGSHFSFSLVCGRNHGRKPTWSWHLQVSSPGTFATFAAVPHLQGHRMPSGHYLLPNTGYCCCSPQGVSPQHGHRLCPSLPKIELRPASGCQKKSDRALSLT